MIKKKLHESLNINLKKAFKYSHFFKIDILIIVFLFILNFIDYIFYPNFLYKFQNGWQFNDWNVNYQGGFVRRGIAGEFLFYINKFNIDHRYIILLISCISFFHIFFNVIKILQNKKIFYRLFILFNPFGVFYLIQNFEFIFARRDLFYLNFLIYIGKRKNISIYFFALFSIFLILNYETFFFMAFLIYYILTNKDSVNIKNFQKIILFILMPLNVLLLTKFSFAQNFEKLCSSINNLNTDILLNEKNCWGAPHWVKYNPANRTLTDIKENFDFINSLEYWFLLFIIFFFAIFLLLEMNEKTFKLFLLLLLPYFSMFAIAPDWGRVFVLIFFIIFISYSFLQINNQVKFTKFNSFLFVFPVLINIFINVPTHIFQNINILEIRSLSQLLSDLYDYFYFLFLNSYILFFK